MNRIARPAKAQQISSARLVGETVRDMANKVGVVVERVSATRVLVQYGPGVSYVMYASGLRIAA